MTVSSDNCDQMKDIYVLSHQLGVNWISFSPIMPVKGVPISIKGYDLLLNRIINTFFELLDTVRLLRSPLIVQDPIPVIFGYMSNSHGTLRSRFICPAAKITMEIDIRGDVYPCPFLHLEEFRAGNIFQSKLSDIWRQNERWGIFREDRSKCLRHPSCLTCSNIEICRGACPAAGYHIFKDPNFPDPRCIKVFRAIKTETKVGKNV